MSSNRSITMKRDATVISDEKGEVVDLLGFTRMQAQLHVKKAANASQYVQLEHSAVNSDDCFKELGGTFDIAPGAVPSNEYNTYSNFLRYIRLRASNSITTQPTITFTVIAKEY